MLVPARAERAAVQCTPLDAPPALCHHGHGASPFLQGRVHPLPSSRSRRPAASAATQTQQQQELQRRRRSAACPLAESPPSSSSPCRDEAALAVQAHDLSLVAFRNRSDHWHASPGHGHITDASRSTPLPFGSTYRDLIYETRAVSVLSAYDAAALHILAAGGGIGGGWC
ncbi:hypothetical protein SEVIR_7G147275v4 [Setaria viridis]